MKVFVVLKNISNVEDTYSNITHASSQVAGVYATEKLAVKAIKSFRKQDKAYNGDRIFGTYSPKNCDKKFWNDVYSYGDKAYIYGYKIIQQDLEED